MCKPALYTKFEVRFFICLTPTKEGTERKTKPNEVDVFSFPVCFTFAECFVITLNWGWVDGGGSQIGVN